jgi:hypothetical protein
MRTRRTTALAAVVTTAALGGLALGPAQGAIAATDAAPRIISVDVTPEPVVLYKSSATRITFTVRASDDTGIKTLAVLAISDRDEEAGGVVTLKRTAGSAKSGVWTGSVDVDKYEVHGLWGAVAQAQDLAGNRSSLDDSTPYDEYLVQRNTRFLGFNVSPEPVRKGQALKVTGKLQALHPTKGYVAYAGKTLSVEFRALGAKTWTKVGTVTTTRDGSFTTRSLKAAASGTWRVRFGGTTYYAADTTHGDYVEVR